MCRFALPSHTVDSVDGSSSLCGNFDKKKKIECRTARTHGLDGVTVGCLNLVKLLLALLLKAITSIVAP